MSTRARIGVMHGSKCKSVYCHFDGYLDYVGAKLLAHYDSSAANNLVALGDISSLGRVVGEKHPFSATEANVAYFDWAACYGHMTTFYGRDRGETGCEYVVDHSFEEFLDTVDNCGADYYYIMRDGVWYCGAVFDQQGLVQNGLVTLSSALGAEVAA